METNIFDDEIKQVLAVEGLLTAMPHLLKFYPQLLELIGKADKGIDDILGDNENEKMIVLTKKEGITLLIVLDRNKQFTLNNKVELDGSEGNPILSKYEKNEWKNKILNSTAMQIIKEKYEKENPPSETPIINISE